MSDAYTIAADAAEKVIKDDIAEHVPPMFQGRIPDAAVRKLAEDVGRAVVDALTVAPATPSNPNP